MAVAEKRAQDGFDTSSSILASARELDDAILGEFSGKNLVPVAFGQALREITANTTIHAPIDILP